MYASLKYPEILYVINDGVLQYDFISNGSSFVPYSKSYTIYGTAAYGKYVRSNSITLKFETKTYKKYQSKYNKAYLRIAGVTQEYSPQDMSMYCNGTTLFSRHSGGDGADRIEGWGNIILPIDTLESGISISVSTTGSGYSYGEANIGISYMYLFNE